MLYPSDKLALLCLAVGFCFPVIGSDVPDPVDDILRKKQEEAYRKEDLRRLKLRLESHDLMTEKLGVDEKQYQEMVTRERAGAKEVNDYYDRMKNEEARVQAHVKRFGEQVDKWDQEETMRKQAAGAKKPSLKKGVLRAVIVFSLGKAAKTFGFEMPEIPEVPDTMNLALTEIERKEVRIQSLSEGVSGVVYAMALAKCQHAVDRTLEKFKGAVGALESELASWEERGCMIDADLDSETLSGVAVSSAV